MAQLGRTIYNVNLLQWRTPLNEWGSFLREGRDVILQQVWTVHLAKEKDAPFLKRNVFNQAVNWVLQFRKTVMRIFIEIWVIQPQKLKLSSIEIIQAPHLSSCGKMRRCCWNSWTANNTRALCPMEMFPSSLPRFILAIKVSLETKTRSIFLIFNDSVKSCERLHLLVNGPKVCNIYCKKQKMNRILS